MIKVTLLAETNMGPHELASAAALTCYQPQMPERGKAIDVEKRLFKVGHHTTLQHSFFSFAIEGIAVGDVTFGLHLTHPFYNSDQRSGRYCGTMFSAADYHGIDRYLEHYWGGAVGCDARDQIIEYVKSGIELYQMNMPAATGAAEQMIREERPNYPEKLIAATAAKIAQEQLRVFIPVIVPTALVFTVNLTVLAAMYRVAWSPVLRDVFRKMATIVVEKHPDVAYMFDIPVFADENEMDFLFSDLVAWSAGVEVLEKPVFTLGDILSSGFIMPPSHHKHPVDLLQFSPHYMEGRMSRMSGVARVSVATFGQDQRHRTIARSAPVFGCEMYLPPIAAQMSLHQAAGQLFAKWRDEICRIPGIPNSLMAVLAPYGAVVTYDKSGDFLAVTHEQSKRLCWCAQEEIYHLSQATREEVLRCVPAAHADKAAAMFQPPCLEEGKCGEGARYCGRDLSSEVRNGNGFFCNRRI